MKNTIPKNTIIVLSGVSCVGKTTIAYGLIKKYTNFRRVSEIDIIRSIVRTSIEKICTDCYLTKDYILNHYSVLFKSLAINDFQTAKLQSQELIPYVKEIINRQQQRNISTIIEGAGIIPSTYFPNNKPLSWLNNNIIFINLYLSNKQEHISRRITRCSTRDYSFNFDDNEKLVEQIRSYNDELHKETCNLSKHFKNVFSIDISEKTSDNVIDTISDIVNDYFSELFNVEE